MAEGLKALLLFIEDVESNLKSDKYSHSQLKMFAEASPQILESCGKATMPWIKENELKNSALEKARIDISEKTLSKLKSEGIENMNQKALKAVIEFSLSTLKSIAKNRFFYADNKNLQNKTDEEKREFTDRDKDFKEAVDVFFDVVGNMDKKKVGIMDKIKKFFSKV